MLLLYFYGCFFKGSRQTICTLQKQRKKIERPKNDVYKIDISWVLGTGQREAEVCSSRLPVWVKDRLQQNGEDRQNSRRLVSKF